MLPETHIIFFCLIEMKMLSVFFCFITISPQRLLFPRCMPQIPPWCTQLLEKYLILYMACLWVRDSVNAKKLWALILSPHRWHKFLIKKEYSKTMIKHDYKSWIGQGKNWGTVQIGITTSYVWVPLMWCFYHNLNYLSILTSTKACFGACFRTLI